jgi:lipase
MDIDVLLQAVIGPAMERLTLTFPSRDAYHDYWRPHPAVGPAWNEVVEAYLDHDIHQVDGTWRSKVDIDAIRADGRDTLEDATLLTGFGTIDLPRWFVWSPRGVMDADPLYPRAVVDAVAAANPDLAVVDLHDVNHYTLLLSREGAAQVATVVRDALKA